MKKTKIDRRQHSGDDADAVSPVEGGSDSTMNDEPIMGEFADEIPLDAAADTTAALEEDPRDAQIAELILEREALKDQQLRQRAEFENSRKRLAREAERTSRAAAEAIIRDWLPVVDHLELALQHAPDRSDSLAQGVELVLKQVSDVLAKYGVEPIPAVGEVFSPHWHEAMTHIDSEDVPENRIAAEYQRGYRIGDQILRPSKVAVSRGASAPPAEDGGEAPPP
ncbi:MAG: nucleotide exchange factor GrpE [Candidatus Hydrogenedentes bacterium]|nr:nucleotide exchange factor GrpE [Candidatus Hydrogenedentota bacterium]